ncbi:hypothetical protein ACHAXA_009587 [Cyclostephanos tholiformis]|uniref:Uncharacterized protein n=1 Tax=Cyclostephanos tholiformis TaxID=382380 RepID=A0ABD3R2A6_9STRA
MGRHETLSLLFHRDGVPPNRVTDDSTEQTIGDFRCRLRNADCHLCVTEPYKRDSTEQKLKTGSQKTLWDHCLELEALVCSNTSNDIYMTNGQVPETIMKGTTADISHMAEFGWYDWVMFRENVPTYPDDKMVLGHYLGLAIDMGSALTAKIPKDNGQFIFCSTMSLIALSILSHDFYLMSFLGHILDPLPLRRSFMQTASPLILTTLRTAICLVQTLVMRKLYLSLVTTFSMPTSCCLVARDNADNPVGLVDTIPILDTQSYIVDFADGNQAKLTANLIAGPFYSLSDLTETNMSSWTGLLTTDNSTMLLRAQTRSQYALTAVLALDVPP